MALTPAEIERKFQLLSACAEQWGVKPSTLAQYIDMAGSYSNLTSRDSGVPRKLPPRASMEGIMLASTVTDVLGTAKMRNIVSAAKLIRSQREEQISDRSSDADVDADSPASERWSR